MLLSPIIYIHHLKWAVPMSLMLGSAPCFMPIWVIWRLTTAILPIHVYNFGDCVLYSMYQRMILFFVEHYAGVKIRMYGDVDAVFDHRENVIYLSNHQSTVDWFVADLLAVRQGSLGDIRYILKDGLRYLPIYGFYFRQHGGVYISRGCWFKSDKAARDLDYFAQTGLPLWLVIFPEGTRYNPENAAGIEASQAVARDKGLPVLNQVLTPRVKATQLSVESLHKHVDAVYDVTVGYSGTVAEGNRQRLNAPAITDLFSGRDQEIHIHIKRISMSEVPTSEEDVRKWLHHRFELKDRLLSDFYSPSAPHKFPGVCHETSLSVWHTLPSALFFSGLFVGAMSCERGRSLYWKVALVSTLGGYLWACVAS